MCGISGVVALSSDARGQLDPRRTVLAMSHALRHRGPDSDGVWCDPSGWAALAHRRLAIVDLSPRGNQPMSRLGSSRVICFNGEIYNFRSLRRELEGEGLVFYTNTDTEVILAATEAWGVEGALRRFRGCFAFALWDARNKVLYLARDRAGEKPLYTRVVRGHLLFASELRGILAAGFPWKLRSAAVSRYLSLGYVPEPLAVVEGVYKLPPGSYASVEVTEGKLPTVDAAELIAERAKPYWQLPKQRRQTASAKEDIGAVIEEAESILFNVVQEQLACDVPVGVFLSGGVDSALVAATVKEATSNPVATFTVKFGQEGFDESMHAAEIARYLGLEHHVLELTSESLLRSIVADASSADEPTANASYFSVLAMSRLARQHVSVVLSGDGGDEVFAGYNRYRQLMKLCKYRRFAPVRKAGAALLERAEHWVAGVRALAEVRSLGMPQAELAAVLGRAGRFLHAGALDDAYRSTMRMGADAWLAKAVPPDPAERCARWEDGAPFLRSMLEEDFATYLPGDNLAKVDRASMFAALEVRLPLLDRDLVEFAYDLPDHYLIRDDKSKFLLREMLARRIPRQLFERPKMGFTVPVRAWLLGPLRSWMRDLLLDRDACELAGLDARRVVENLQEFEKGRFVEPRQIWGVCMLIAWVKDAYAPASPVADVTAAAERMV